MTRLRWVGFGLCVWVAPTAAHAAPSATVSIGGEELTYTEALTKDTNGDGRPDRLSYYDGDRLVAAAYDNDDDGEHDLWILFDEELRPRKEIVDRDRDGRPDVERAVDEEGRAGPDRPAVQDRPTSPASPPTPTVAGIEVGELGDPRLGLAGVLVLLGLVGAGLALRRR